MVNGELANNCYNAVKGDALRGETDGVVLYLVTTLPSQLTTSLSEIPHTDSIGVRISVLLSPTLLAGIDHQPPPVNFEESLAIVKFTG